MKTLHPKLHQIPPHVLDAASVLRDYFAMNMLEEWELNGICSSSAVNRERVQKIALRNQLRGIHKKINRIAGDTPTQTPKQ